MTETPVRIEAGDIILEGLYKAPDGKPVKAALLCHPHPLYGGTMQNNVVETLQKVFQDWGCATLRFNFRGVGLSTGSYGEGEGEAEDVLSAANFLLARGPRTIYWAGYSFGAWAALKAVAKGLKADSSVLVSPPVDFLDFADLALPPEPALITLGDRDQFCTPENLQAWLSQQTSSRCERELIILRDCDHFYWGHEATLALKVRGFLTKHHRANGG